MKQETPCISIIMPTYNREKLILRPINSIIKQNYKNWQLIVIDDQSTDNTYELIQKLSSKDDRIKIVKNTGRKGLHHARNIGFENASGEFIAFLDSDDEWNNPDYLSNSINTLKKYKKKVCVALWKFKTENDLEFQIIPDQKKTLEDVFKLSEPNSENNVLIFKDFLKKAYLFNIVDWLYVQRLNTLIVYKDVFNDIGYLSPELPYGEDTELFFRIFWHYDFCYINEVNCWQYKGDNNIMGFDWKANDDETLQKLINTRNGQSNAILCIKKQAKKYNDKRARKKIIQAIQNEVSHNYFNIYKVYQKKNKFAASLWNRLYAYYYRFLTLI